MCFLRTPCRINRKRIRGPGHCAAAFPLHCWALELLAPLSFWEPSHFKPSLGTVYGYILFFLHCESNFFNLHIIYCKVYIFPHLSSTKIECFIIWIAFDLTKYFVLSPYTADFNPDGLNYEQMLVYCLANMQIKKRPYSYYLNAVCFRLYLCVWVSLCVCMCVHGEHVYASTCIYSIQKTPQVLFFRCQSILVSRQDLEFMKKRGCLGREPHWSNSICLFSAGKVCTTIFIFFPDKLQGLNSDPCACKNSTLPPETFLHFYVCQSQHFLWLRS